MLNLSSFFRGLGLVAFYAIEHERNGWEGGPVWAIPAEMLGAWEGPYFRDTEGRYWPA